MVAIRTRHQRPCRWPVVSASRIQPLMKVRAVRRLGQVNPTRFCCEPLRIVVSAIDPQGLTLNRSTSLRARIAVLQTDIGCHPAGSASTSLKQPPIEQAPGFLKCQFGRLEYQVQRNRRSLTSRKSTEIDMNRSLRKATAMQSGLRPRLYSRWPTPPCIRASVSLWHGGTVAEKACQHLSERDLVARRIR